MYINDPLINVDRFANVTEKMVSPFHILLIHFKIFLRPWVLKCSSGKSSVHLFLMNTDLRATRNDPAAALDNLHTPPKFLYSSRLKHCVFLVKVINMIGSVLLHMNLFSNVIHILAY